MTYNIFLGDALHRQDCSLKESQADFDSSRKTNQKISAKNSTRDILEVLKAKAQAELAMLQGVSSFRPAYAV